MTTRLTIAAASVAALLGGVGPVMAHHSFAAEYDANKPIKLAGTVTKIEWTNPHCYFYIDVKNAETGKIDSWALELGNPNALLRNGWTRKRSAEALPAGTKVSVTAAPPRAGGNTVLVLKIENEKGEDLLGLGATPGPPGPPPAR